MFQVRLASKAALREKHKKAFEANKASKAEDLCVTSHHFEIALTKVSPSVSNLVSNN
jgi:SpoVK/Ycf46/Vps4 family AAA+-type ATPase